MMKRTLFIAAATLVATTAWAEEVDSRLDADSDGRVIISNLSGSVEVSGWSENEIRVTGSLGDDVEEFIFERSGDTVRIKVKVPDRTWGRKDVASDLTISVPEGSSLEIGTVSADIDVEGVRGEMDLEAVSGDITVEVFSSDVQAESVSGDVEVTGTDGSAEWDLVSVSGDVSIENVSGDLDVEVVSGDVDVVDCMLNEADLETVNGDVTFDAGLVDGGRLEVDGVNGSVDVDFTNDVSGRFSIETFNGRIRNCFGPEPERTSRYAPGWELEFEEGSGDSRVSIATLNGSITLCRD